MSIGWVAHAAARQHIAWMGGGVHQVIFDGAATANRLAAFRSTMPAGAASPVHVHDHEDETIFVLTGEGVCWAGAQRWEVGAGDAAFLPRHLPHTYAFTADSEILTVCNPAGMEDFFRAAGWDLENPKPEGWVVDMEVLRTAGEAGGQHVLGPPLAPDAEMPTAYLPAGAT